MDIPIADLKSNLRQIIRTSAENLGIRKWSTPALNDIDKKLEKYLDFNNGFFIEAGANDGYRQSNTYYFEKCRGWHGLLVEAIPSLYEKCKKTRKKSVVKNCALVSQSYNKPSLLMHFADLMSGTDGAFGNVDSRKKHISKGLEVQNLAQSYKVEVPARTLTSLLNEIKPRQIDLFTLDVEGVEMDVFDGLDFSKYRPRWICIEVRNEKVISKFMKDKNYRAVDQLSHHDYLFKDIV